MDRETALASFIDACTEWAAGGRGLLLVDAAATALAEGLDSPTLRVLAGAPSGLADQEAVELATDVFTELGITIEERLSRAAIVRGAQLIAREFLAAPDPNPRDLVRRLFRMSIDADYPAELNFWLSADDSYALFDEGIFRESEERLEREVAAAARALVDLS